MVVISQFFCCPLTESERRFSVCIELSCFLKITGIKKEYESYMNGTGFIFGYLRDRVSLNQK